jgi:hypothetical protein
LSREKDDGRRPYKLAGLTADNEIAKLAEMDKKMRLANLEELNTGAIDMEVTGIPMAELEELFNESRRDEDKVLYPMSAQLHERYDYVLIFTTNETDKQFLHEVCGIRKEVSYKMSKEVGLGRSIPFARFMESLQAHKLLKENANGNGRTERVDTPAEELDAENNGTIRSSVGG